MIPIPNIRNKTPNALRYFQRITATLPLLPARLHEAVWKGGLREEGAGKEGGGGVLLP